MPCRVVHRGLFLLDGNVKDASRDGEEAFEAREGGGGWGCRRTVDGLKLRRGDLSRIEEVDSE